MKHARRYTRKTLIKTFAEYGIHLWLILLIASVVSAYAFQFYTRAAEPQPEPTTNIALPVATDSATLTPTEPVNTPTPTDIPPPAGPVADFSFKLPGIGSGSANLDPKNKERQVTFLLYDQNENPNDARVKPLYTVATTATYDSDPTSDTYSQYVNKNADLGANVPDGTYQIALKTNQTLNNLIKDNPSDIGGKTFDISKGKTFTIKPQNLLTGDIHPVDGDNVMDINDYNDFVSCYSKQPSCPDPLIADIDDNGVVEGTDYNLLLLNFQTLLQQGLPVPSLNQTAQPTQAQPDNQFISPTSANPKPTAIKKPSPKPVQKTAAASSSAGLIIGLIVFALFIGVVVVAFIKRKTIMALISHKQELTAPEEQPTEQGAETTDQAQPETTEQPTQETVETPQTQTPAQTQEPAAAPPAEEPKQDTTPQTNQPQPAAANDEGKEYYVKKGRVDDAGAGFWLTLTADSGPIEGHYNGTDAKDGFAIVKGEIKNENGKSYMEVSSMKYED